MNLDQWKSGLSNDETRFYLIAACLMVLICLGLFIYYLKRARLIEDTPTSKIRSAAQGYVELVGAVSTGEAGEQMAPLSGTPCVWYDFKVQRYRDSGKNGHWDTIDQGTSEQWFQIEDKTGTCVIDPQGANIITEHKRTWYGNTERPAQQQGNETGLLRTFRSRRYRYFEKFIYIHDVIYALGHFQSLGGGRQMPDNHKITGEVIREWKRNYDWILQNFDKDENDEIDMQEWEQVRKAASQEAEKRRSNLSETPTTHILSKTPNKQFPFILSTHSQKTLSKQFRNYAAIALVGGISFSCFILTLTL